MRRILQICEAHGQPPSWWDGLADWEQGFLVAHAMERDNAK